MKQLVVQHTDFTLLPVLAQIVVEYLASKDNPFGAADSIKQGFDPGPESELPQKFYRFWYSQDAKDLRERKTNPHHPIRLNYETHFPPVFISEKFSLRILEELGLKFRITMMIPFYFNHDRKAEKTCWGVLEKDVVALGAPVNDQVKSVQALNRGLKSNGTKTYAKENPPRQKIGLMAEAFPS